MSYYFIKIAVKLSQFAVKLFQLAVKLFQFAVKIFQFAVKVFQFATKLFQLMIMVMISSKDKLKGKGHFLTKTGFKSC